jgi:hypothetical protein
MPPPPFPPPPFSPPGPPGPPAYPHYGYRQPQTTLIYVQPPAQPQGLAVDTGGILIVGLAFVILLFALGGGKRRR